MVDDFNGGTVAQRAVEISQSCDAAHSISEATAAKPEAILMPTGKLNAHVAKMHLIAN